MVPDATGTILFGMGLNVPQDLSFIGFDGIDYGAYLEVPLTTVAQDFHEIGVEAANLIMERIANPAAECKRMVLPVRLITRKSTAALENAVD